MNPDMMIMSVVKFQGWSVMIHRSFLGVPVTQP